METPLYDILRGKWNIHRVIDDRREGIPGEFTGTAHFEGAGVTFAYAESGALSVGAQTVHAERRYHWVCTASGATVSHADNSPFHSFSLKDGHAVADHQCGDDLYRGAYEFASPTEWQVVWTVSGPRKDYTSTTRYRRALSRLH